MTGKTLIERGGTDTGKKEGEAKALRVDGPVVKEEHGQQRGVTVQKSHIGLGRWSVSKVPAGQAQGYEFRSSSPM